MELLLMQRQFGLHHYAMVLPVLTRTGSMQRSEPRARAFFCSHDGDLKVIVKHW